jgi:PPK2 family polyphosphate:nucleotide phosphotransferase
MKLKDQIKQMYIKPGSKVSLKDHPASYGTKTITKDKAQELMDIGAKRLQQLQDKLFSNNEYSVLIVIQAMDAAGKDSLVKHVLGALSPGGVKVHAFKVPSEAERRHDYLWRHNLALPEKGEIGIFVRSHFENVLVTRVHPKIILAEKIPGINTLEKVNRHFFKTRFRQINDWERRLTENGTRIIKLFLHSSKEEQKKQFIERIDNDTKNWKFSTADLTERGFWDQYMEAYEDLLSHTSTEWAPWYVVPADDRWFTRISSATIISREFEKLKIDYPVVTGEQKQQLEAAKQQLLHEQ